jgi:hypothetical protein
VGGRIEQGGDLVVAAADDLSVADDDGAEWSAAILRHTLAP